MFERFSGEQTPGTSRGCGATRDVTGALRAGRLFVACGVLVLLARTPAAVGQPAQLRSFAIPSLAGRDNFDVYCSGCHGVDGRGNGPLAARMSPRPSDLTLLARAHGGVFPGERIMALLRSGEPGGHRAGQRSTDMPNWWPIFTGLDPSDVRTAHRIANLIEYIESLQAPSSVPGDPSTRPRRPQCATCHGDDARGGRPLAQVTDAGPDRVAAEESTSVGNIPRRIQRRPG